MQQIDLLVKNAQIVTMDTQRRVLNQAALAVTNDVICAIGPTEELEKKYSAAITLDATNKVVFPGFINTHSHLFQVLLKGLGRDKLLFDWLDSSVRPAIRCITPQRAKIGALVGCLENLHSGVTTIMDYQYCHGHHGLDDAVLEAIEESGIRTVYARSQTNVSGFPKHCMPPVCESEDDFFADVQRLDDKYKASPLIDIALAPGIIWDISEEGYKRCREIANQRGLLITMHLNESDDDDAYCQKTYGMDTIPFLEKMGILGPDFVAVHCVKMTEEEIKTFEKHDVKISHNPVSNMILASGVAPVPEFLKAGLAVSLATDGAASNDTQDMMEVIKIAALIHKCVRQDAAVISAAEVLEMATIGGARCIARQKDLGSLELGKKADFFLFNPKTTRTVPMADPIASLVYSSGEENIETVVVGGKVVMQNRRMTTVNEAEALEKCQAAAAQLRRETGLANTQWGQVISVGEFL